MFLKEPQNLINTIVAETIRQVSVILTGNNLDSGFLLLNVSENGIHFNVIKKLKTQTAQITQVASKLGMINPRVTFSPVFAVDFGRYNKGRQQRCRTPGYISIPPLDQLKKVLNFPHVLDKIRKEEISVPGVFLTIEDEKKFRKSRFFQTKPAALQSHLYIDEVQMCPEIGSHTKKKQLSFYLLLLQNCNRKMPIDRPTNDVDHVTSS